MPTPFKTFLADELATLNFGGRLAQACPKDQAVVIFLNGNLGAGKTTLTRGFLRGIGFHGKVKSPTYTLVEPYEWDDRHLYHFDFYRIKDSAELQYLGLDDYFTKSAICLIEWPECGQGWLPAEDLSCYIELNSSGRDIQLIARSPLGLSILKRIRDDK